MELPKCPKCSKGNPLGILLPLSDYAADGAAVIFKAWACANEACGFALRIDKGAISYDRVTASVPVAGTGWRSGGHHPDPKPPSIPRR